MTDIVERLRSAIELDIAAGLENRAALETEAATEIETLRRQVSYYVDEMIPKFTSDSLAAQKIHAAEIETLRARVAELEARGDGVLREQSSLRYYDRPGPHEEHLS